MKPPCKGCPDRMIGTPNCHDTCEKYLAYCAERELISQARQGKKVFEDYIHDHHKAAEKSKFNMQRDGIK